MWQKYTVTYILVCCLQISHTDIAIFEWFLRVLFQIRITLSPLPPNHEEGKRTPQLSFRVTIAAKKHRDQKQAGQERVYVTYASIS